MQTLLSFLFIFLLPLPFAFADIQTISRTVEGYGETKEEAISVALSEAMSQVGGVKISSQRILDSVAGERYFSEGDTQDSSFESSTKNVSHIEKVTSGKIDRYKVNYISDLEGEYLANVTVYFDRYKVPGVKDNRRSIAILELDSSESARRFAVLASNALNTGFIQSRKFTVLDRKFNAQYEQEKSLWLSPDASRLELKKLGHVKGADYFLVGKVTNFSQLKREKVSYTNGGKKISENVITATVHYRILIPATKQVKWSDTHTLSIFGADASVQVLAESLSKELANKVISNIYPSKVAAKTASKVIINQGGNAFDVGEVMVVYGVGEKIFDPTTKEYMGRTEDPVAKVKIERIEAKLSYASVVDGRLDDIKRGYILRSDKSVIMNSNNRKTDVIVEQNGVRLW